MVSGRLIEVHDRYFAILNLKHPDGKRLQKRFDLDLPVANNKRRAQTKLNELCAEYTRRQQVERAGSDVLLADYVRGWIERRKPDISPSTYRNYAHMAEHHVRDYFGETPLSRVTFQGIEAFDQYLRDKGLSSTTVRHHHMLLQTVLRDAVKRDLIAKNPAEYAEKPMRQKPQISVYTVQEAHQLLEAVQDTKLELPVTLTLLYGFRRSEVLGLRWEDVHFEDNTLLVCHTVVEGVENGKRVLCEKDAMKEEASRRTMPLFEPLISLLRSEWERKKEFAPIYVCTDKWGNQMKPDVLTHDFSKFLAEHGLRHLRFHDLRHTCASLLIAGHTPLIQVQHWLGHQTMLTTANLYAHLDPSLIEECGDVLKKN